jgi:poly(ADP-ribose) glycohydrolase
LIASRLFVAVLQNNECLTVYGAERFSKYSGYARTFRFEGDFVDKTEVDTTGHIKCALVAIDAVDYHRKAGGADAQYTIPEYEREAGKALVGFSSGNYATDEGEADEFSMQAAWASQSNTPVATGNWGCGVFGGDRLLKALLQAVSASVARRSHLEYFTVGDEELSDQLKCLFAQIAERGMSVGCVWAKLGEFARIRRSRDNPRRQQSFLEFLQQAGLMRSPTADLSSQAEDTHPHEQPVATHDTQSTLDAVMPAHAARARQLAAAADDKIIF